MFRGVDIEALAIPQHLARQRIDLDDALDLIAKELDAHRQVFVGGEDLQCVAAHTKLAAHEVGIVALVLDVGQPAQHAVAAPCLTNLQRQHDIAVLLWRAEAIDARDRGDDQRIAPLEEAAGRGESQLLDLRVELALFLHIGVAAGDVGLWLVVVVVADKVLDSVIGEEFAVFSIELRGQRLVRREHQRRALQPCDDLRDGVRLAAARHSEQGLVVVALLDAGDEPLRWRSADLRSAEMGRRPRSRACALSPSAARGGASGGVGRRATAHPAGHRHHEDSRPRARTPSAQYTTQAGFASGG